MRSRPVCRRGSRVPKPPNGLLLLLCLLLLLLSSSFVGSVVVLGMLTGRPRPHRAYRAGRANAQPRRQALQDSHPPIGDPRELLIHSLGNKLLSEWVVLLLLLLVCCLIFFLSVLAKHSPGGESVGDTFFFGSHTTKFLLFLSLYHCLILWIYSMHVSNILIHYQE